MNPLQLFLAYAAAFEETFRDDDWSRLEPFFTEDAVYAVSLGPPLGGRWEGRDAVLSQLRESVEELDRLPDSRKTEILGAPSVDGDSISFGWRATYEKAGCPDLVFGGVERAVYRATPGDAEAGRIEWLEDTMDEGSDTAIQDWFAKHFAS